MRVTKRVLEERVFELNDWVFSGQSITDTDCNHTIGWFVLDINQAGYRLCEVVNVEGGQRDLTPRTTAKELDAYISGILFGYKKAIGVGERV